jgi:gas vesicle protein
MNKGRFALGALVGAVAGVIAGLLTAPKSGKETRADLKTKADELKDVSARKAGTLKGRAIGAVDEAKHKVRGLGNKGRDDE